ncbi:glycosyltransferase family 4 protein [Phenylobacterium sp.]|uniref:glycosyltransferase family 4 protein n=1 Tax=Phenylobacterium sp. TaxID=1871053 RepID=UPI002736423A|nr:glycosyltransferase family 4 protein [Phenylobacterium sp.]MDP3659123.1 glycosyltransferase family 4 protein [Phenylobacterium sp.]
MRFAMVTTFYPPYAFGGDATYVRGLARALAALGHEVEVIHCRDAYALGAHGASPTPETDDAGVVVHTLHHPLGALSPLVTQQTGMPGLKSGELRRLLDRDFDVVHFHNISLVGGPGVLALSRAPVTLYTLHEHWLLCATHIFWKNRSHACDRRTCISCSIRSGIPPQLWRYTPLRDLMLQHVDRLISPSEYTARRHREGGVVAPIEVLPLFSALEPDERLTASTPARPYFLFVGRVTASKGVEAAVRAFAQAGDLDLVVVGAGDAHEALETRYGGERVRFTGGLPQAELGALYAGATALVFPSLAPETFGLAVIEAAAFSTPALVRSGAGGAEELVADGQCGRLYQNETDLIAQARALIADPDLAQSMGEAARGAYMKRYTRERHLEGYLRMIEAIRASKAEAAIRTT